MPDIEQAKKKSVDFVQDVCLGADSPWTTVALVLGWRELARAPTWRSVLHFTHSIAVRPSAYEDLALLPDVFRLLALELPSVARGDMVAIPSERQSAKGRVLERIERECLAPLSPWRTAVIVLGWRTPGTTPDRHFTQAVAVKPAANGDLKHHPSALRELATRMSSILAGPSEPFEISTPHRRNP